MTRPRHVAPTSTLREPSAPAGPGRGWLLAVATGYLAFVIYGSLVPLNFRPMPFERAVAAFAQTPYLDLGLVSRADWVANILLFIPLAFLCSGVLWPARPGALRLLSALTVVGGCVALALAIEFTQLFFPGRTVSINDIVAESLGGLLGTALWVWQGARFSRWVGSMRLVRGSAGIAERLLFVYLAILLGYNLLPLDLTLSPVEIYHKWNDGNIVLLPFSARYEDAAHMVYDVLSDVAVWIPVALLWKMAYRQPSPTVWMYVVAAAATLEFLQLFVYSRVTDLTDILTAAIGGALGLMAVSRRRPASGQGHFAQGTPPSAGSMWLWPGLVAWLGVLATVFWYPFNFSFDRGFVRDRLVALRQIPFQAYYFGSEFRAITEVLHKAGFMLPLGVMCALAMRRLPRTWPAGVVHAVLALSILSVAGTIELGQVFLPGKNADLTDVMIEFVGGMAGYTGCLFVLARLGHAAPRIRQ